MSTKRSKDDTAFPKLTGVDYSAVMDRPAEDRRFEREKAYKTTTSAPTNPSAMSSTFDAFQRMAAGLEGRKISDKINDPNRPTWEQYKKENEDKLDLVGADMRKMIEYRAELDRERERRLKDFAANQATTSSSNKDHKKKASNKHKRKRHHKRHESSSSDSSSSDEDDSSSTSSSGSDVDVERSTKRRRSPSEGEGSDVDHSKKHHKKSKKSSSKHHKHHKSKKDNKKKKKHRKHSSSSSSSSEGEEDKTSKRFEDDKSGSKVVRLSDFLRQDQDSE